LRAPISLIVISILLICKTGDASPKKDVVFEKVYSDNGITMDLQGTAVKKLVFMEVFKAAFYLQQNIGQQQMLEDVSKRIEITYFQPVSAQRFFKFIRARMIKSMTKEAYRNVSIRVESMADFFVDIKPGDLFSMTYTPPSGTTFELNRQVIGVIEGADFGKGIFSTWLGDHPFDHAVKRQILGLDNAR